LKLETPGPEGPSFTVRFHGVRGSFPVPGASVLHFGGNTSCIEVETGPFRVAMDCGTGIIGMGSRLADEGGGARILLLLSHVHHDHTLGWPFFKPAYDRGARLYVHGPARDGEDFGEIFQAAFSDPYFPVDPGSLPSHREFATLSHGDAIAWRDPESAPEPLDGDAGDALVVRTFRNLNHPNGGVLNYRLERNGRSLVLATDIEGSSGESGDLAEFARGADLLIHDSQYTDEEYPRLTKGWGHSTWGMAVDTAERAGARRLVLYHHDPNHDDAAVEAIERLARDRFPRAIAACEGLEIRF